MHKLVFGVLAGSVFLGLASCEKVIDLKLADSTPQMVIEGEVVDDNSNGFVKLSRSVQFTDQNRFPTIAGAFVTITDITANIIDTLKEETNGYYYFNRSNVGQPGHTYNLTVVTHENGTFTATSTMPQKVPFDSLYLETATLFGQKGGQAFPIYTDPAGIPNFYRFQVYVQGRLESSNTRDDRFSDGRINGRPVGFQIEDSVKTGAPVQVQMQCIDKSAFEYFSSQGKSDGNSAAPANPVNNISGGALGYFSAHTISSRTVSIP